MLVTLIVLKKFCQYLSTILVHGKFHVFQILLPLYLHLVSLNSLFPFYHSDSVLSTCMYCSCVCNTMKTPHNLYLSHLLLYPHPIFPSIQHLHLTILFYCPFVLVSLIHLFNKYSLTLPYFVLSTSNRKPLPSC